MDLSTLCFVTMAVPDLDQAERFYVDTLGFRVTRRYEPTRWISLSVDEGAGPGLGLMEDRAASAPSTSDVVEFWVSNLTALVDSLPPEVRIVLPPQVVPWGSFKAEIEDCFGRRLGLVQRT